MGCDYGPETVLLQLFNDIKECQRHIIGVFVTLFLIKRRNKI